MYIYILQNYLQKNTLAWARFLWLHVNLSLTSHTASIWLGVLLAVFRYLYVRRSTTVDAAKVTYTIRRIRRAVAAVIILSVAILIPNYALLTIVDYVDPATNVTVYEVTTRQSPDDVFGDRDDGAVLDGADRVAGRPWTLLEAATSMNFWIHALVIKLIPCALMTVFGVLLVRTVQQSSRRRHRGCGGGGASVSVDAVSLQDTGSALPASAAASTCDVADGGGSQAFSASSRRRRRRPPSTTTASVRRRGGHHSRTTVMMIAIIVIFLVAELPQGVLALCSGLRTDFFDNVYVPLGDVMDIVALVNNGINFTLYCAMSQRFRQAFLSLFCPACIYSPPPPVR